MRGVCNVTSSQIATVIARALTEIDLTKFNGSWKALTRGCTDHFGMTFFCNVLGCLVKHISVII